MPALDDDSPKPLPDDDIHVDRGPHRFLGIPNWLVLILLTVLAGVLRFSSLDKPSVWGDEAATYRRVCGSFPEMVQELRAAGFMPTHYLLTWWIKEGMPYAGTFVEPDAASQERQRAFGEVMRRRGMDPDQDLPPNTVPLDFQPTKRLVSGGIPLTPFALRFLPALCGMLLVPAIYFLASQLVARRTALLTAIFTCCSAYALGYSRDAKMYMQFWLFVTLHVGCLFWWLSAYRTRRAIATTKNRSLYPKQEELGIGVAGVLPGHHVGHIARAFIADAELRETNEPLPPALLPPPTRLATLVRWACWLTAGLAMIAFNAIGLAVVGLELLFVLATEPQRWGVWVRWLAAIFSPVLLIVDLIRGRRERAVLAAEDLRTPIRPAAFAVPTAMPVRSPTLDYAGPNVPDGIFARLVNRILGLSIPPLLSFAVGAFAIFSLWNSYKDFTRFYDRVLPDASTASMQVDTGDAGISWVEPYNRGRTSASLFRMNGTAYLTNWEWIKPWHEEEVDPRALLYLKRSAIILWVAIALGFIPWRQVLNHLRRRGPRKQRIARERGPMPATSFLLLAAWLVLPAYGLYVAGGAWRVSAQAKDKPQTQLHETDFVKVRAASPIEAAAAIDRPVQLGQWGSRKPEDQRPLEGVLANEIRPAIAGEQSWEQAWHNVRELPWSDLWQVRPAADAYPSADVAVAGHELTIARSGWWTIALCLFIVATAVARLTSPQRMLVLAGRGLLALIVLGGLLIVVYLAVPVQNGSVWMPRYAGFVWPAFAIGVCVLIRRLPFLPLRWGVIALLLATNLTNFVYRCRIAEPPTAQMASNYLADRDRPDTRLFGSILPKQFGGPGTGSLGTHPFVYYCAIQSNTPMTPATMFRAAGNEFRTATFDAGNLPNGIRGTLARAPQVTQFDVWFEHWPEDSTDVVHQRIAQRLTGGWQMTSSSDQIVYDHWTWRQMYALEHQHWERAPTTAPTSSPGPRQTTRPTARRSVATPAAQPQPRR